MSSCFIHSTATTLFCPAPIKCTHIERQSQSLMLQQTNTNVSSKKNVRTSFKWSVMKNAFGSFSYKYTSMSWQPSNEFYTLWFISNDNKLYGIVNHFKCVYSEHISLLMRNNFLCCSNWLLVHRLNIDQCYL